MSAPVLSDSFAAMFLQFGLKHKETLVSALLELRLTFFRPYEMSQVQPAIN